MAALWHCQGMPRASEPRIKPAAAPLGPARQGSIRDANLALLYRLIIDAPTPPSRAALAATTGMTRATASALADALLAAGLVKEVSPPPATGAGRPAAGLVPADGGPVGLGLEINVDYLAASVVDLAGNIRDNRTLHGDQRGRRSADILGDLAELARKVSDNPAFTVAGAAVAVPGLVETPRGRIRSAPNLRWQDVEIAKELRELLPETPFAPAVGNEADFAALAEAHDARRGAGGVGGGAFGGAAGAAGAGAAAAGVARPASSAWRAGVAESAAASGGSAELAASDDAAEPAAGADASAAAAGAIRSAGAPAPDVGGIGANGRSAQPASPAGYVGGAHVGSQAISRPDAPLTDFLYVSGEIGVGAGIILDGELFRGARGWAGEIGHVTVEPGGALCRCGALGCLETVAGLEALQRTGPEAAADALGRAVATAVNLLDLPAVVLGGVYARPEFAAALLPGVEQAVARHVVSARWAPVAVRVSQLGETAAATGAAIAVIRRIHADPAGWLEVLTQR